MTFAGYVSTCNHLVSLKGFEYILSTDDWAELDTDEKVCYTAGLIEYCNNKTGIPKPEWYVRIKDSKLKDTKYMDHVELLGKYNKSAYDNAYANAIPEFLNHNVVVQEVGNAV